MRLRLSQPQAWAWAWAELGNYWMVMAFFGNHVSKCNRLSKNMRPIQAIDVLYRLWNKQKHYLIYSETPCRLGKLSFLSGPSLSDQFWIKGGTIMSAGTQHHYLHMIKSACLLACLSLFPLLHCYFTYIRIYPSYFNHILTLPLSYFTLTFIYY